MENSKIEEMMASYLENPSQGARERLVGEAAAYVFCNLKRILAKAYPADEDARSDFILWLYPQLDRIIGRFDPKKASFATYLAVNVKYRHIRFCAERARQEQARHAAESEELKFCKAFYIEDEDEPCACEPPAPYAPRALEGAAKTEAAKRRMARGALLLALKSAFYLSEEMAERIADFCGLPRGELKGLLESVRRDYSARQRSYEELRLRRYRYYIRAFACRERLAKLVPSSMGEKARAAEKELAFCCRQEERIAAEMERLRRGPSNRYLAGLLGLPRGSVNSSLARIKKRLYSLEDEDSTSDIK